MELGRLGVWVGMDGMSAAAAAAFAKRVEERGYGALWIPEGRGRNALVLSSWLLSHTNRLIVATGIANIYARDPMAMAGGQRALAEQSGGRFLLGVGLRQARGHDARLSAGDGRSAVRCPTAFQKADDGRRSARTEDDGPLG